MADDQLPSDEADVSEVNSQLNDGIRTCRSVVSNYRMLLAGADARSSSNDNIPDEGESLSGIDER